MNQGPLLLSLVKNDVRLILREPLLWLLSCIALGLGIACRFVLPAINESLAASGMMPNPTFDLRFSGTYPLWVAFIGLWQGALMPGTVFAFLLLDEKEDGTLTAMRVTPVPSSTYLSYRLAMPFFMAFCLSMLILPLMGLAEVALWQRLLLACGAAWVAPWTTLLIAAYANDKVQGLAFTKFFGIAGLLIIIGWLTPALYEPFFFLFPPFLIAKSYWMAAAGSSFFWIPLLSGTLILALGLGGFARVASRRLKRTS